MKMKFFLVQAYFFRLKTWQKGHLFGKVSGIERSKKYTKYSQALELIQREDTNLGIAIKLGLTASETIEEHKQYMQLIGDDKFCEL
jgi:hypothetical protein